MEKRKPSLADLFTNHKFTLHDKYRAGIPLKMIGDLQAKVRKAKKYVFDDDASMRIGEVTRDIPDLLVRESRFARAPYELTWIEINSVAMWRAMYANNSNMLAEEHPDRAQRLGMIIDNDAAYLVAGVHEKPYESISHVAAFVYTLNGDPELWTMFGNIVGDTNNSKLREIMNGFYWGTTTRDLSDDVLYEASKHFSCHTIMENFATLKGQTVRALMAECNGDLRTIIAILLMLNRPSITMYKHTLPNHRGFIRNKLVAYTAHTVVTISLDPQPILKLIGTSRGESIERRWHEVEGHFCHDKTSRDYARIAGCIHDWCDTDDDWIPMAGNYARSEIHHWQCQACGGKRWWRNKHERGNQNLGEVVKEYKVTT